MKKLLDFFLRFGGQGEGGFLIGKKDVDTTARKTIQEYKKTFVDLARYDRGERVSNQVSR